MLRTAVIVAATIIGICGAQARAHHAQPVQAAPVDPVAAFFQSLSAPPAAWVPPAQQPVATSPRFAAQMRSGERGHMVRASFYGGGPRWMEPSTHTASGARFNQWAMTAAHRSLPFGTRVEVCHEGHCNVCTINDRGPAAWTGNSIDLSRGCAYSIGMRTTRTISMRVL